MAGGLGSVGINDNRLMLRNTSSRWWPRLGALALWALAAASLAYWGLKFSAGPNAPAAAVAQTPATAADPAAVARLLGSTGPAQPAVAAAPAASSRFALLGVVAGRSQSGAALIAIDGKPAKPFVVGTKVEEGLWLQSVAPRRATLAPAMSGPPAFSLEMPLPKRS